MKTYIYTLTDPNTNEIRYVGKSNNPQKRLYDHIHHSQITHTHKNMWIKSLIKEGKLPILNIIDEVLIEEWQEYEIYWIDKLKKEGHNLTNHDIGGNGTTKHRPNTISKMKIKHKENPNYNKCMDRDHIINKDELYQKYIIENLSLNKCASFFNTSKATIYRNISDHNFHKSKDDWKSQLSTREKNPVNQYDISGNLIKEWDSANHVKEFNSTNILKCCHGRTNIAYGYIWRFKGDKIFREKKPKIKLPVIQYDKNNNIIDEFNSVRLASTKTGISRVSILYCCKGKQNSAGGYIWRYKIIYN